MKKFIASVIALGGVALASSVAAQSPPPPVYTWTGFYIGVNGGGASMVGPSRSYDDHALNTYFDVTLDPSSPIGSVIGFHGGYNWQFAPNWLIGVEGDWNWSNLSNTGAARLVCAGPTRPQCGGTNVTFTDSVFMNTSVESLASVRGRLGYIWNQWLFYGTGGVAWADMNFNSQVFCTNVQPSFCNGGTQSITALFSDTRVGSVVGGGLEYKAGTNWVFGAEYLYYHFGDSSTSGGSWVFGNGTPAPFFECTVPGQNCATFTYGSMGVHAGRLRVTYQFTP